MKGLATLALLSGATGMAGMLVGSSMDAGRMEVREIYHAPDRRRPPHTSFGALLSQDHLGAAVTVAW